MRYLRQAIQLSRDYDTDRAYLETRAESSARGSAPLDSTPPAMPERLSTSVKRLSASTVVAQQASSGKSEQKQAQTGHDNMITQSDLGY